MEDQSKPPESWRRDTLKSLQLITAALREQNDRQERQNARLDAVIAERGNRGDRR